ncbi:MAG: mCpol domain-containing protein [Nodosilinea sp. LVE1205-7]
MYAFLDGDNIGLRIEELLSKAEAFEATLLSENIKTAMLEIDRLLNSKPGIKVIILGGDDVLIQYEYEKYGIDVVDEIIHTFKVITGLSMSCGIGLSIEQSIVNLDNAKKSGRNKIEKSLAMPLSVMSKIVTLYLFVDSETPDVYINSIVCCSEKQNFILKEVCLVGITKEQNSDSLRRQIDSIQIKIKRQLDLLQISRYLYRDQKSKEWLERDISIQNHEKLRYAVVNNIELKVEPILYESLGTKLIEYTNSNKDGLCVFDLSAVKKAFLIDVYTILRLNRIDNIFTFELKKRGRTYDDQELIHNLSLNHGEYEYVPLAESLYTSGSVITSLNSSDLDLRYADKINSLVDNYSDEIARFYLLLILLVALVILIICVYIVFNNGWTWLEAWTFIALAPAVYALSVLVKVIWGIEFTINPNSLYRRFKLFKSKKIRQRINS